AAVGHIIRDRAHFSRLTSRDTRRQLSARRFCPLDGPQYSRIRPEGTKRYACFHRGPAPKAFRQLRRADGAVGPSTPLRVNILADVDAPSLRTYHRTAGREHTMPGESSARGTVDAGRRAVPFE